jgi:hypothetical protein
VVITYGRFGATYRNLSSSVKNKKKQMGPINCTETSVINYNYSLHNNSEKRSYNISFVCVEHGLFLQENNKLYNVGKQSVNKLEIKESECMGKFRRLVWSEGLC